MPRFYFHLTNGHRTTHDSDGVELADQDAARREAIELAQDLLRDAEITQHVWSGWQVQILDGSRRVLSCISFDQVSKEASASKL
jgi:hypothetical protein